MILLQLATSRRDFAQLSKVKLNLRKYSTSQMVLPRSTRIENTFANLAYREEDYGLPAEWHFFATSHGKGPCDGIGGTVKRLATKASLQRTLDCQIQTPHQLYEWAQDNIAGVTTIFCPKGDIAEHETFLKARLEKSITVAGTQKLHAFYSIHGRHQLVVKRYSNSGESRTANVVKV